MINLRRFSNKLLVAGAAISLAGALWVGPSNLLKIPALAIYVALVLLVHGLDHIFIVLWIGAIWSVLIVFLFFKGPVSPRNLCLTFGASLGVVLLFAEGERLAWESQREKIEATFQKQDIGENLEPDVLSEFGKSADLGVGYLQSSHCLKRANTRCVMTLFEIDKDKNLMSSIFLTYRRVSSGGLMSPELMEYHVQLKISSGPMKSTQGDSDKAEALRGLEFLGLVKQLSDRAESIDPLITYGLGHLIEFCGFSREGGMLYGISAKDIKITWVNQKDDETGAIISKSGWPDHGWLSIPHPVHFVFRRTRLPQGFLLDIQFQDGRGA